MGFYYHVEDMLGTLTVEVKHRSATSWYSRKQASTRNADMCTRVGYCS